MTNVRFTARVRKYQAELKGIKSRGHELRMIFLLIFAFCSRFRFELLNIINQGVKYFLHYVQHFEFVGNLRTITLI